MFYFQLSIIILSDLKNWAPTPPPPVTARSVALPFSPAGPGRRTGRLAAVMTGICVCGLSADRTEADRVVGYSIEINII